MCQIRKLFFIHVLPPILKQFLNIRLKLSYIIYIINYFMELSMAFGKYTNDYNVRSRASSLSAVDEGLR